MYTSLSVLGLLIIHKAPPELPYFPVLVQDWYHDTSQIFAFTNPFANPGVNGSGFSAWTFIDRSYTPYTVVLLRYMEHHKQHIVNLARLV